MPETLRALKHNFKTRGRPLYYRLRGLWLVGRKRSCPLCGGSFRRFLPKGVPARAEAMCPRCLSLERHRLLWLFLQRSMKLGAKPVSVLHFAPEPALREKIRKLPGMRYASADLAAGRASTSMDITRLGFRSGQFDVVLCCHVLEHIPDDRAALAEIKRMLKPGGRVVIQIPLGGETTDEDPSITDPAERLRRFGQDDHVRFYGRDFAERLAAAGFRVDTVRYAETLGREEIERSRLLAEGENEDWIFVGYSESA